MEKIAQRVKVVDVDTHIIEPYDLWTSRLGEKWDLLPHVEKATHLADKRPVREYRLHGRGCGEDPSRQR